MSKKILVIDDDPKMRVLEKTVLVHGGYAVETASDGVEGLEKLQTGRYEGIVLDVMMPRMDGYETARHQEAARAQHNAHCHDDCQH